MKPSEHNLEALWAYVHVESDAETRKALEAALETDPALAAAAEDIRVLHGSLQKALTADATRDEDLCSEIMDAWDREHEPLHLSPETQSDVEAHDPARRRPRLSIWHSGLAIAACLLIMMGVQTLRPPAALTWNAPTMAKSRSDESTAAIYNEFEIEEMHGMLVSEVGAAYDAADMPSGRHKAWILSSALSIRPDQSFTLSVRAQNRYESDVTYSWDYHYDNLDDYRARVRLLAGDVVDGLTSSSP